MDIICAKLPRGEVAKYVVFFAFFLCSKSCDAPECESGMKPCFCPFCLSFSGSHSIFMVIVVILFLVHFLICSQGEVQSSFLCNVCVLSQFQIGSSTCVLCVYIVKTRFWAPIPDQKLKCFNFINVQIWYCRGKKKMKNEINKCGLDVIKGMRGSPDIWLSAF